MRLPKIYKEKPGVLAPMAVWIIFHHEYMYGPHESIWRTIWEMISEWKSDRHLIG